MDDRALRESPRNRHRLEGIVLAMVVSSAFWCTAAVTAVHFIGPVLALR